MGMRRSPSKKATERRKRPRAESGERTRSVTKTPAKRAISRQEVAGTQDSCRNCALSLVGQERALFVEEEVGRVFCSERCIATYFTPEIERLEKEFQRKLSNNDLNRAEREELSHLRWITLQEPDEVWREKTLNGDYRYTLISEFQPGSRKIWCVCICLFLRGEPSFLYLAFSTRNAAMSNTYRRGEQVEWLKTKNSQPHSSPNPGENPEEESAQVSKELKSDRLAGEWTEDETFLAQANQERREDDIPPEEFATYQSCIEETLETPDEVWSVQVAEDSPKLYHFIRYYPEVEGRKQEISGIWYVIIARETEEDDEQIEILDAFPTRDLQLADRYRRGTQEVGHTTTSGPANRVVH